MPAEADGHFPPSREYIYVWHLVCMLHACLHSEDESTACDAPGEGRILAPFCIVYPGGRGGDRWRRCMRLRIGGTRGTGESGSPWPLALVRSFLSFTCSCNM